jgi:signal transduction histidine kinase
MTFRTRLQAAFVVLAVVSVGGLALGVRWEMTRRLTAEYQSRVASLVGVIREDLAGEGESIGRELAGVTATLADDNRLRLALSNPADRSYLLDYAANAMRLTGLTMLQIQDADGRILSSGHFRNEFDRMDPELPRLLGAAGDLALVQARAADGEFLALARADSVRVGRNRLWVVGGRRVGPDWVRRLARGQDLVVVLETPAGTLWPADSAAIGLSTVVADRIPVPFVADSAGRAAQASVRILRPVTSLAELRRSVDGWTVLAGLVAVGVALLLGTWASSRLSRPLADLAQQAASLDLERLDAEFAVDRDDEVGTLARGLNAMTGRLRRGAQQLREVERRAAVGDLARQVTHDIKNGLAPIRNVLRHLAQVADREPNDLPRVFGERKATLDSSVQYLETLAANYARLSPAPDGGVSDLRALVEETVRGAGTSAVVVRAEVAPALPPVKGDAVAVRRILENLVSNAVDAAGTGPSARREVRITAELAEHADGVRGVRVCVSDTGPGMTAEELDRAFQDFYTTKPGGTGLGLTVVRRLVTDLGGTLKVQTEPGAGTTVVVTLPTPASPKQRSGA